MLEAEVPEGHVAHDVGGQWLIVDVLRVWFV